MIKRRLKVNVLFFVKKSKLNYNNLNGFEIDPSTQLQISTNSNDLMGPMASPSPNSRQAGPFAQPVTKNRVIVGGPQSQQQNPGFQHPAMARGQVSVQIPRTGQQIQSRVNQSPFSPQTPQSPHDQFPLSPAPQPGSGLDPFSRPPSENSQQDPYLNVIFCVFYFPFYNINNQYFSHRKRHVHLDIKAQMQLQTEVRLMWAVNQCSNNSNSPANKHQFV